MPLLQLDLAQLLERFKTALDGVERIFAGFMLNDIPLRLAFALAEGKDFRPIELVLANDRLRAAPVRLDVNAARAARILLEHGYRIRAAIAAIARVELQNDLGPGVGGKNVPWCLALEPGEVVLMRVIAH